MPRLPWRLIARAWKENSLLPLLLRPCRDLTSARLELRWLEEHARNLHQKSEIWKSLLRRYCRDRSRGKPLQYILGTEFFGPLEIKCRPGVLIPRQDTAVYVMRLLDLLGRNGSTLPSHLRVLDICTGTGCIPLLFAHSFPKTTTSLQILGVDISKPALSLARENQQHLSSSKPIRNIEFLLANVMLSARDDGSTPTPMLLNILRARAETNWDILISNPPYISPEQFNRVTERSVRNYEPKLALVPRSKDQDISDEQQADMFYHDLLLTADILDTKIILLEVGDISQAKRVARYAKDSGNWDGIEIWRDEPGAEGDVREAFGSIPIIGTGNGRSVFCYKSTASKWIA